MEEPGYWALTRRADIAHASLHPGLFSSAFTPRNAQIDEQVRKNAATMADERAAAGDQACTFAARASGMAS
jgi:hypothetical protein